MTEEENGSLIGANIKKVNLGEALEIADAIMDRAEKGRDLDAEQKLIDAEDIIRRSRRLETLYDEQMDLRREDLELGKKRKEVKSRLTQIEWYIQEQLKFIIALDKPIPAKNDGRGVPEKSPSP